MGSSSTGTCEDGLPTATVDNNNNLFKIEWQGNNLVVSEFDGDFDLGSAVVRCRAAPAPSSLTLSRPD